MRLDDVYAIIDEKQNKKLEFLGQKPYQIPTEILIQEDIYTEKDIYKPEINIFESRERNNSHQCLSTI